MSSKIIEKALRGEFALIAELGVNFMDFTERLGLTPIEAAKDMVKKAAQAGVHCVKFQAYKPESIVLHDTPVYWETNGGPLTQYESLKEIGNLALDEFAEIARYCESLGVEFLVTPFCTQSTDYLDPFVQCYKTASADLTNHPLISHIAKKKKPVIMSTGASSIEEIKEAVSVIRTYNSSPLVLMHCVLEYPATEDHANLRKITALRREFPELIIGYSDHVIPDKDYTVLKTAYALGAVLIEKHYTYDKTIPENDHEHAMDPDDAKKIIAQISRMESILGSAELIPMHCEAEARVHARRSIVSAIHIDKGSVITREMLDFKRPGTGISPALVDEIVGTTAVCNIPDDTVLTHDMLVSANLIV